MTTHKYIKEKMFTQQYLPFAALLVLGAVNTEAFSFSRPALVGPATTPFARSLTYLRAEEPQESQEEGEVSDDDAPPASGGADILNSPEFLKRKVDVLKSDLEAADAEIAALTAAVEEGKAEWGNQLEKLKTEVSGPCSFFLLVSPARFILSFANLTLLNCLEPLVPVIISNFLISKHANIQERLGNQNKQGDNMAVVQVVREMLGVLDNFDRALGSITPETDEQKEIEAEFKATYAEILATFEKLGVKTVETVGTEFNYEYHQAVMQMPTDEFEEGIVCSEMAKGFIMDETLIRAAMVAVAR